MNNAFPQAIQAGSVHCVLIERRYRTGSLDGVNQHVAHRTAGVSLDQVGVGVWLVGARGGSLEDE